MRLPRLRERDSKRGTERQTGIHNMCVFRVLSVSDLKVPTLPPSTSFDAVQWHKNHAICYTFNTCTAQWSATTPDTRHPTHAPCPPNDCHAPLALHLAKSKQSKAKRKNLRAVSEMQRLRRGEGEKKREGKREIVAEREIERGSLRKGESV